MVSFVWSNTALTNHTYHNSVPHGHMTVFLCNNMHIILFPVPAVIIILAWYARNDLKERRELFLLVVTHLLKLEVLLGIFDKKYAHETAGSSDEHTYVAPDLFTAETPLGLYQGITEQVVMSRTPGSFRTVLVPRGSSKPEWLQKT